MSRDINFTCRIRRRQKGDVMPPTCNYIICPFSLTSFSHVFLIGLRRSLRLNCSLTSTTIRVLTSNSANLSNSASWVIGAIFRFYCSFARLFHSSEGDCNEFTSAKIVYTLHWIYDTRFYLCQMSLVADIKIILSTLSIIEAHQIGKKSLQVSLFYTSSLYKFTFYYCRRKTSSFPNFSIEVNQ